MAIDELGGPQAQFTYQTEDFPITNTVLWYLHYYNPLYLDWKPYMALNNWQN